MHYRTGKCLHAWTPCIFQPRNFTGWGSEGIKAIKRVTFYIKGLKQSSKNILYQFKTSNSFTFFIHINIIILIDWVSRIKLLTHCFLTLIVHRIFNDNVFMADGKKLLMDVLIKSTIMALVLLSFN